MYLSSGTGAPQTGICRRRIRYAQLLFTGGSGDLRDLVGADQPGVNVAEQFFREQGLDPERLILERESRNTAENA